MGSPHQICELRLFGDWVPALPEWDWQGLKAESPDKTRLALVRWNTDGNVPGFHIVRIDVKLRRVHTTRRIMGICRRVFWDGSRFAWERHE